MVRTQILLPDALYRHAKEVAEAREISLAELVRRGVEMFLDQYSPSEARRRPWKFPVVRGMGWTGLSHEEIRDAGRPPFETEGEEGDD